MSDTGAIILAAGLGTRLRAVVDDRPKGLIEISGQSLVGRSVALLRAAGIEQITIVAGYRADEYRAFAHGSADLRLAVNDEFATTGSMASLAVGLDAFDSLPQTLLVLESDIVYEARALTAMLSGPSDATLVSGWTDAGDEVFVSAPGGLLRAMSKRREDLSSVDGEFVGITRLSPTTSAAMRDAFARFSLANHHGRMDYETGALVEVAAQHRIHTVVMRDLWWGEIDDERHHERVTRDVWPRVQ